MLELKKIYKNYLVDKKPFPALKNINLNFDKKGFVSILGPSGCGKTTLLNLIGGLDQYTSGDLIINKKSTKHFTDKDWDAYRNKRVGFVFQNYNLVPHLTIEGNVEISMALSGISKKARAKRALKALEQVGLKDIAKKKPNQLSGGQMQRVAIARSLVNDPEIILADEPTGALDSVTSVQVLEILKEVSKTHLVIMVTHNTELADKYSTRIIRLKDGVIISDSKPEKLKHQKDDQELELEDNKHTHMSFMTALASSARSLLTKKGRTILTATAASFGIIGVAIVLAMSNGFSSYVHNVEIATASTVPINISPYVAATNQQEQTVTREAWPDDANIYPFDDSLSGAVAMHRNKITQDYADYCMKLLESPQHYASSVLENHEGLDFNIFTTRPTIGDPEIIKIDQYSSGGTTGMLLADVGGLPSSIFHELYGGEDYIMSIYDVVAGKYPQGKNEVCLVCDRWNRIPNETLIKLGFLPDDGSEEYDPISFNDMLGKTYKAFLPKDVYGDPIPSNPVSCNKLAKTGDKTSLLQFESGSQTQTITQFKDICKDKTALKTLYEDAAHKSTEIKVVGIIRPSKTSLINLMPGSVCYTSELKDYYINEINKSENDIYREAAKNNWCIKSSINNIEWVSLLLDALTTGSFAKISQAIEFYSLFTDQTSTYTPTPISPADTTSSAYSIYESYAYKIATEFDHNLIDHIEVVMPDPPAPQIPTAINLTNDATLADFLAYANGYSTITSILVFPKDLTNKPKIFDYLDKYNEGLEEDDKILYQDIAGAITDTIGTMIDVISTILIAFSSISLLVSCVMTGIITYTSVLERTKEIGILRAIGARKKDVGRLFEAEAVIVGGIGGLIGVIFTFMVEAPVSILIAHRFPIQNIGMICNLNPLHALLLVGVSILLTFVAGFIPARKAAKKDPVVALRTE